MGNKPKNIINNNKLLGISICYMIIPFLIIYAVGLLNGVNEFSITAFMKYIIGFPIYYYTPFFIIFIIWFIGIILNFNIRNLMLVLASIELLFAIGFSFVSLIIPYITLEQHINIFFGVFFNALVLMLFVFFSKRYK